MDQVRTYVGIMRGESREVFNNFLLYFRSILDEMKFAAKQGRYSYENEIRLMLAIPKGEKVPIDYVPTYEMKQSNGKRYIEVDMPKQIFRGLSRNTKFTDDEWEEVKEYFGRIGYRRSFIE